MDPNQGPDQLAATLLHEVLHAVWSTVGLSHANLAEVEDREETVVAALEPLLLDVLRRNPKLVRYLTAGSS